MLDIRMETMRIDGRAQCQYISCSFVSDILVAVVWCTAMQGTMQRECNCSADIAIMIDRIGG